MTTGGTRPTTGSDTDLTAWARRMRAEGLADRTITEWPRVVLRAARWSDAEPTALTEDQLIDYLAALPSAGTRQSYFTALAAWHRWLAATGRRDDNPMTDLRRPRVPRRAAHPVATAHIDAVLGSGIRRRTRTAILLGALQGLRVHEAAKVRGEDVDLVGQRFRVIGKGGVEVWMPLHPVIAEEAKRYPRHGWWFPSHKYPGRPIRRDSLSASISAAMKRSSVPGTAHSLRHWLATELLNSGADARTVQEIMRHASLATIQIYTQVSPARQRRALAALPSPRPTASLPPSPVGRGHTTEGVAS